VLTVPASTVTANAGQSLQAFSLFSATDPEGDPLTYFFQDGTSAASSGHFVLNGTALANGAGFHVNAAQLGQLTFVAGTSDDSLSIQLADDKGMLSAGVGFQIHVASGAAGSGGAVVVNNSGSLTFSTFTASTATISDSVVTVTIPEQFRFADSASNDPAASPGAHGIPDGGVHPAHDAAPAAGASADAFLGAAIANAIIPDLFGDAAALHDLHPSAHLADYFMV
jgi:hypothetical protein